MLIPILEKELKSFDFYLCIERTLSLRVLSQPFIYDLFFRREVSLFEKYESRVKNIKANENKC